MPAWTGLISEAELEVYRRAGYQKSFGLGERPALLIIDVEYNFTGDVDEPILDSIAKYSEQLRPDGLAVDPAHRVPPGAGALDEASHCIQPWTRRARHGAHAAPGDRHRR